VQLPASPISWVALCGYDFSEPKQTLTRSETFANFRYHDLRIKCARLSTSASI